MKKTFLNACQALCLTFDLDSQTCEKKVEKGKSFNSHQKETPNTLPTNKSKQMQVNGDRESKPSKFTKNYDRPTTTGKNDLLIEKSIADSQENTNIEEETTNNYQKLLDKYRPTTPPHLPMVYTGYLKNIAFSVSRHL
jgi:hypothetical protein